MVSLPVIFFGCLGAMVASFVGVISERLYTGQSFIHGRSQCNSCGRHLTARDLVPVVSWLVSGGRCRVCGVRVPVAYAFGEAILGVLFALSTYLFGLTPLLGLFVVFLSVLFFVVLYDLRHTVVPSGASTALVILGLMIACIQAQSSQSFALVLLVAGIIGLSFFLLHTLSKGRVMGLGDAPIALALALATGSQALTGLLFSFWIGAAVGICILVGRPREHRMGIEIPFVPFLAAGFLLAYFTGWNPFLF